MGLFEDQKITDVVTVKGIKDLTGVSTDDFYLEDKDDPEGYLDRMLEKWIEQIGSHVHTRVKKTFGEDDTEYLAMVDIIERTVAKMVGTAQQQRSSPIIQMDDYTVDVINTSDVIKDLKKELRPFRKRRVSIFSSLDEYEG